MALILAEAEARLDLKQRFKIARAQSQRLLARDSSAHKDWMDECVPAMMDAGKEQIVAVAACLNIWRDVWEQNHPDGADDPGPDRPRQLLQSARAAMRAFNEADHPRDPAGTSTGGQFTSDGGASGGSDKPKGGKGKVKAKKEDFDKAKIRIGDNTAEQEAFLTAWNDKVGAEPAEFKKNFMGGLDGSMEMKLRSGNRVAIDGRIENADGDKIGDFTRDIYLEEKRAYSAYFKLQAGHTGADVGKKLLAGNIATYEQLGIEKVAVGANIDVGGYAWAKYGYVPSQESWASLRGNLERKLTGTSTPSSSSFSGTNLVEADDWDMLPSDRQDDVRDEWMRSTRSDFIDSEVQNWRESGDALSQAKTEMAHHFSSKHGAAAEVLDKALATAREIDDIPFTNAQIFAAMNLEFDPVTGDGNDDPEITFDDSKLQEPESTADPNQINLPFIEPIDPAKRLTASMRDTIIKETVAEFNKQAEINESWIDAPDYLADNVEEYQDEHWRQMDDRQKLDLARRYDMANIEIEQDDDEMPRDPEPPAEPTEGEDPLLAVLRSTDPKSIWKIADSARGKELLLGTSWQGVLNLRDKAAMDRFNKYVGRA